MTPRTPDERCENCPAWVRQSHERGECHGAPPSAEWDPAVRHIVIFWPNPFSDDWCIPGIKLMREGKTMGDEVLIKMLEFVQEDVKESPAAWSAVDVAIKRIRRCAELEAEREKLVKWCEA